MTGILEIEEMEFFAPIMVVSRQSRLLEINLKYMPVCTIIVIKPLFRSNYGCFKLSDGL